MSGRHATPVRGLMSTKKSPLFEGLFGRMFRTLPAATFGATDQETVANLTALAGKMAADPEPVPGEDGPDPEESGIPALYTYLGQFIDHDLTFDPASSLQKQNDPDALVDFRTPAFDLDNVYGRGPDDVPYLYDGPKRFLLGADLSGGNAGAKDLPRNVAAPARALIGDPRNDENTIVSQLQGLFLRFHNRLVNENPALSFADAQRLVRFHYQYVVVNDFLPRVVHSDVLAALRDDDDSRYEKDKLRFYKPRNRPFMPVEFSAAAYRLGHSMVRPGYRLNDAVGPLPIFPVAGHPEGLTGFRAMIPTWGIDWGRFIDLDVRDYDGDDAAKARRLQFAYRIDTSTVDPLAHLPPGVASDPSSLPLRNLLRGWRLGLPSGQSVAKKMGVTPLDDSEILLGKFVAPDSPPEPLQPITAAGAVFAGNCPLWTYILAETRLNAEVEKLPVTGDVSLHTPRLGPVGGRIVAEVFLGILFGDSHSLLSQDPDWTPAEGAGYALKDFVKYALGM